MLPEIVIGVPVRETDKFMMEKCNKFTKSSLENGIKIDTICALVKEYRLILQILNYPKK